jgi:hypothetical protein
MDGDAFYSLPEHTQSDVTAIAILCIYCRMGGE